MLWLRTEPPRCTDIRMVMSVAGKVRTCCRAPPDNQYQQRIRVAAICRSCPDVHVILILGCKRPRALKRGTRAGRVNMKSAVADIRGAEPPWKLDPTLLYTYSVQGELQRGNTTSLLALAASSGALAHWLFPEPPVARGEVDWQHGQLARSVAGSKQQSRGRRSPRRLLPVDVYVRLHNTPRKRANRPV